MDEGFVGRPCRVYCAGPLFNQAERTEMTAIADALCDEGYLVYLPHRDGMEFRLVLEVLTARGWDAPTAAHFLHAAIFALDVYQLAVECDAVVWNLNGRTPDEGAVSEAAIAWALGKPLLAYRDDARSLIAGRVNPLLVGLVDFETVEAIRSIPAALGEVLRNHEGRGLPVDEMPPRLQIAAGNGRRLWDAMLDLEDHDDQDSLAGLVAELFAPQDRSPVT